MALDFPSSPVDGQVSGNYIYSASSGAWKSKPIVGAITIQSPTMPTSANPGDIWINTSDGTAFNYLDDGTSRQWVEIISSGVPNIAMAMPTGGIIQTALGVAPSGWLICDGSAVSRTAYATLFASIGTTYGTGDGSTTFNIPNLKGKVPVGKDSSQTEFDTLAKTSGTKTHTLSEAELPVHTHANSLTGTTSFASTGHRHSYAVRLLEFYTDANVGLSGTANIGAYNWQSGAWSGWSHPVTYQQARVNNTQSVLDQNCWVSQADGVTNTAADRGEYGTVGLSNASIGSGSAHNNLQPYVVLNYIIKT